MTAEETTRTRTVVGFDGSAHGWRVLDWAVEEAAAHNVPLLIVHCWQEHRVEGTHVPPVDSTDATPSGSSSRGTTGAVAARPVSRATAALLANAIDRARGKHPTLEVEGRLIKRSPVAALLSLAKPGDLIAIGTQPDAASRDPGSTANRLLTRAPCDVVVLPHIDAPEPGPFPGHVIAMIDDSATATSVLARAFDEAEARQLPVTVVRTDETVPVSEESGDLVSTEDTDPGKDVALPWQRTHPGLAVHRASFHGDQGHAARQLSGRAAMLIVGRSFDHRADQAVELLSEAQCPVVIPAPSLVPYQASAGAPEDIPTARTASNHS